MLKNTIPFRILSFTFALLICFAVLSNPLTADATAVAGAGTAIVDTAIVIGSIVTALGVGSGSDVSVFNTLVKNIISHLNLAETFQIVTWVVSGCNKSYAPKWLVEAVRSYLFSSSTVKTQTTCSCVLPAGTVIQSRDHGTLTLDYDCYAYYHAFQGLTPELVIINPTRSYFRFSDGTEALIEKSCSSVGWVYFTSFVNLPLFQFNLPLVRDGKYNDQSPCEFFCGKYEFSPQQTTVVSEGFTGYQIGNLAEDLDDAYPVWMSGNLTLLEPSGDGESEEEVVYVPITVPGTYPEVTDITQDEAQAGDASVADSTETVGILQTVLSWLSSIWEAITSIPGLISDALTAALSALVTAIEAVLTKLFVPDVAVIEECVADLRAQFPFFDSIIATGQYLFNGISSGEPPVIYIHLEDSEGLYTWGNTVAILDMSFYSRYKPVGDVIMSSALITFFAWRTLKHLPGIISGASSDVEVFKEI